MQLKRLLQQQMLSRSAGVPADKKLSREAVASVVIHSLFQFGASMSGVFLNLYLWRLTHSLFINGLYNIIFYAAAPFAYAFGGWLAKRKDRLFTYRLGIGLIAVFYLFVVLIGEKVVDYYVLFAIFGGMASGCYWVSYLTLMYDVSTEQNRIRYLAVNMIYFTAAGLAGPALAGFVITRFEGLSGYVTIFSLAFVMFVLAIIGSLQLKAAVTHRRRYFLGHVLPLTRKNREWFNSLFGYFVLGLLQGPMLFLPNILLFRALPREDLVGYFGVLFSGIVIFVGFLISRYAREEQGRMYMLISAAGYVAGSLMLLFQINLGTVIAFMVFYSVFSPLQGNTLTSRFYALVSTLPLRGQLRIESVVFRESFVNMGRVLSIICLLVFARDMADGSLARVLIGASAVQFGLIFLLKKGAVKTDL